ncbi:hypothetical protein LLG90_00135 [Aromatoleum toluclasticum]|uniref:hypothetical protein n=1 Tax=Aromatoleum toluclasticum TaxID=92003 RepID=UPI001D18FAD2|nr:hypothetical protein [Aromatoleum toluclasticum]MCC4113751.1 hypothetical protein [Aromatoleum toluclasticum]
MSALACPKFLQRELRDLDYRATVIATLGPSGTSSEFAARHLTDRVELFDSYEFAEEYVLCNPRKAAFLVANAYQHVNQFYISRKSEPVAAFFLDTPPYVLATRGVGIEQLPEPVRISSHRAPAHLIRALLPDTSFILVETYSTGEAARMVADAEAGACLTTRLACERNKLTILQNSGTIPMLWTIFASSEKSES